MRLYTLQYYKLVFPRSAVGTVEGGIMDGVEFMVCVDLCIGVRG